jgi:hypothetical protein
MKKYVNQVNSYNFLYPNNTIAEYDVDIIHQINDNSVSGTTSAFTISFTGSNINVAFNYTWALNGAEPFINNSDELVLFSVHMMDPSKVYYKPWRMVWDETTVTTGSTTSSGSVSFTVTPSQLGLTSFTSGVYNFEIRMIGHRAIFPICEIYSLVAPSPTPTPTRTPTPTPSATPGGTPAPTTTPTPTPSMPVIDSCSKTYTGTYTGTSFYTYPDQTLTVTGSSITGLSIYCVEYDRPNRFTAYNSSGFITSTGWVGTASYPGPWGTSLSNPGPKTMSYSYSSGNTPYYIRVEAGPADPSAPTSDGYEYTVTCS